MTTRKLISIIGIRFLVLNTNKIIDLFGKQRNNQDSYSGNRFRILINLFSKQRNNQNPYLLINKKIIVFRHFLLS